MFFVQELIDNCSLQVTDSVTESQTSREILYELKKQYDLTLGCDSCIDDADSATVSDVINGRRDYFVRVSQDPKHQCFNDRLLLRRKILSPAESRLGSDRWIFIRPCPPKFRDVTSRGQGHQDDGSVNVCESFAAGEQCHERMHCPFPHGYTEYVMWTRYFAASSASSREARQWHSGQSMERFIDDLRLSRLRLKLELENLNGVRPGQLKFVCRTCLLADRSATVGKRHHATECERGHHWTKNQLLVYVPVDRLLETVTFNEATEKTNGLGAPRDAEDARVREVLNRIKQLPYDEGTIVKESAKLQQQQQEAGSSRVIKPMKHKGSREGRVSTSGDVAMDLEDDDLGNNDVPVYDVNDSDADDKIYDDSDVDDDTSTGSDDDEEHENGDDEKRLYYKMKSRSTLQQLLEEEPQKYKRCTISLDGPFQGKCRLLDEPLIILNGKGEKNVMRQVEVRGRENCGPCFDGDEVVVEMKETKELGKSVAKQYAGKIRATSREDINTGFELEAKAVESDFPIYRGKVLGLVTRNINRKRHTFLCRVDEYEAHLMKPLDGVAPKINVDNTAIRQRKQLVGQKNNLVAIYSRAGGDLKVRKIIKLDPRSRKDMLFVVRWVTNN